MTRNAAAVDQKELELNAFLPSFTVSVLPGKREGDQQE